VEGKVSELITLLEAITLPQIAAMRKRGDEALQPIIDLWANLGSLVVLLGGSVQE
jgi:hypothetical protein